MKKIVFLFCLFLLLGCKSKKGISSPSETEKPTVMKLSMSEVNPIQKNRAYELGKRVLMTCNTSSFKPFTSEEATPEVLKNINKDKISLTCQNIIRGFGQFKDINLIEVFRLENEKITVFRYKCDYEKKYSIKELRISVNDENKITAITTKDWKDAYNP